MNGFSVGASVSVVTVFLQGLLSFFSPCVLPLLPVYLAYLSGGAVKVDETGQKTYSQRKVAVGTLFFVLGISMAFFILGMGFSALGLFFRGHQLLFARVGGVIVILFGLYQLGVFGMIPFLGAERRIPMAMDKASGSVWAAFLMGFLFSFSWTPCVGPVLSGVLLMATSTGSRSVGFLLIAVYTLGFVLPFLAAGFFTGSILNFFKQHRNVVKVTARIGGVLLILMGVLMLTGQMNVISRTLADAGTAAAVEDAAPVEDAVTEDAAAGEDPAPESSAPPAQEIIDTPSSETPAGGEETATEATAAQAEPEESEAVPDESSAESDETAAEPKVFPAPDFTLTDQYGETHTLSDYQGQVVFLNFWATWCPPCRAEMPDIQKLYEEFTEQGREDVVFLSICFPGMSGETDAAGVARFLEENGYTYPALMDEAGQTAGDYYITAFPTTFMIDAQGNIFGYVTGGISEEFMRSIIDQTLSGVYEQ